MSGALSWDWKARGFSMWCGKEEERRYSGKTVLCKENMSIFRCPNWSWTFAIN
jgi:hypothetical protein